jgi:hypothetical protein
LAVWSYIVQNHKRPTTSSIRGLALKPTPILFHKVSKLVPLHIAFCATVLSDMPAALSFI